MDIYFKGGEKEFVGLLAQPEKWIVADADCGGIPLFACPISQVASGSTELSQLVADLEMLSWQRSLADSTQPTIDAAIVITDNLGTENGLPISISETRGDMIGKIWVAFEFWDRDRFSGCDIPMQISDVLNGKRKRLDISQK